MPTVALIDEANAPERTRKVYREVARAFGSVPALSQALGQNPDVLEAAWGRVRAILLQGALDRKTKEFIAVAVSATNGCRYCVEAHTAALRHLGATDPEIVEALAVADLFNGFNALASGLGLEAGSPRREDPP